MILKKISAILFSLLFFNIFLYLISFFIETERFLDREWIFLVKSQELPFLNKISNGQLFQFPFFIGKLIISRA